MNTENKLKALELAIKFSLLFGVLVSSIWAYLKYNDTKEKEFYTYYWNQKFQLFLDTSEAAAVMATTSDLQTFRQARSKYFELFYGQLSLVEGPGVKSAMEAFAPLVPREASPKLPASQLEQPAYKLTIQLKNELLLAWESPFNELDMHSTQPQ
ncbi:hypothetical protein [Coraliomargarita akajimensis]|uniref:Uncharacterized protein n=1 Tax=Coraliomargarita akajimensis (strain DSM 45221 / IAM 15411 / JCM 23193 / KCTC 12865 / 04OKA010-24) TaxID=583355 RepID=D5ER60_CORAD|nr:hypothetical protein [Coraliomargarita akajimensis]ADE55904.1 hypothetical protein Caka_2891 [Coraliomargarita akajimensis DSM 45221]